jgi:hypothetical protein
VLKGYLQPTALQTCLGDVFFILVIPLKVVGCALRDRAHCVMHPDTVKALGNLASTLREQGQPEEAVRIEREVLKKRKQILGEEHPDTISAMSNLTSTRERQKSEGQEHSLPKTKARFSWFSRKKSTGDDRSSPNNTLSPLSAPPASSSRKVFPFGLKLLHDGENSIVE